MTSDRRPSIWTRPLRWWGRPASPQAVNGVELTEYQRFELQRVRRGRQILTASIGGAMGFGVYRVSRAIEHLPGASEWIILAALIVLAAWALRWFTFHAPRVERARRGKLREFGVAVCAHCGYDLADADPNEGRCSECGHDLAEMPYVRAEDSGHVH